MSSLLLRSPAKLNLYLKVLSKRPDGYHDLQTLFERIDLYDDIRLSENPSRKIQITCNHPYVPCGPKNLVFRVAQIVKARFGVDAGVSVAINKRIPVAAGLAGGSSNAAAMLMGLNLLWRLGLTSHQLCDIGCEVGSDVPFFLSDCSWGLGSERGDKIEPQVIRARLWHVLVVVRKKMYSRDVFTELDRARRSCAFDQDNANNRCRKNLDSIERRPLTKINDDVNILIRSLRENNIKRAKQLLANDLESSIVRLVPSLLNVKKRLESFLAEGVSFSGSGPAVFGVTDSRQQAQAIKSVLAKRYKQVFVVRTL